MPTCRSRGGETGASPPGALAAADRRPPIPTALKVLAGAGPRRRRLPRRRDPRRLERGQLDPRRRPRRRADLGDDDSDDPGTPAETEAPEELGYPEFATNNTTRVGGADPASNAAAVALAVFPSATPEQRPDAVVLVDEADWQSAIAAAVLMAEPIRAPLLISTADEVPDATDDRARDARPRRLRRGARCPGVRDRRAPTPPTACRRPGSTAPAPRRRRRSRSCATSCSAGPRATSSSPRRRSPSSRCRPPPGRRARATPSSTPIADSLPAATAEALKRHPDVPVYVLGPSSAISSKVVREIAAIDNRVRRVSGEDPVTNSIALARYSDGDFGWNVNDPGHGFVVVRSDSPLDAVAAAPLSASGTWGPLLLTDSADTLPAALREYLLDVKPGYTTDPTRAFYNHVWVIGDQDAIDVDPAGGDRRVGRIGEDRRRNRERGREPQPAGDRARGQPPRTSGPWPEPPPRTSRCRSATASSA